MFSGSLALSPAGTAAAKMQSAGKQAAIQLEIIHEENKELCGSASISTCPPFMEVGGNRGRAADTNLDDTHARRTCPISYLSVTSAVLS